MQSGLSAELMLARPELGLRVSLHDTASLRILGVAIDDGGVNDGGKPSAPRAPLEAYTRGTDLVVTYPRSSDGVRTQVYWHAPGVDQSEPMPPLEIDVQVSVQTDLLESHPTIHVFAQLLATEVFQCAGTDPEEYRQLQPRDEIWLPPPEEQCVAGVIFRLANTETTYAQLLHPSDVLIRTKPGSEAPAHQILLRSEPHAQGAQYSCTCGLFFETLEKGVIRRARVRGVFVPRENDLEAVAACAERLVAQRLPLTT